MCALASERGRAYLYILRGVTKKHKNPRIEPFCFQRRGDAGDVKDEIGAFMAQHKITKFSLTPIGDNEDVYLVQVHENYPESSKGEVVIKDYNSALDIYGKYGILPGGVETAETIRAMIKVYVPDLSKEEKEEEAMAA